MQAKIIRPEEMTYVKLMELLRQWDEDCQAAEVLSSPLEEYAGKILEVAAGHMGVSGLACHFLEDQVEAAHSSGQEYSAEDFDRYLCWTFSKKLAGLAPYNKFEAGSGSLSSRQSSFLAEVCLSPDDSFLSQVDSRSSCLPCFCTRVIPSYDSVLCQLLTDVS